MNDEVLQSLLSAGLPADASLRLTRAIDYAYGRTAIAAAMAGLSATAISAASSSQSASDDLNVNTITVRSDATVSGNVSASAGSFTRLSVPGAAEVLPGVALFPSVLISGAYARFDGRNVFGGPVSLQGPVDWDGERKPATVDVLSFVGATGGNSVQVVRNQIAALNDYGGQGGSLVFKIDHEDQPKQVITSVTLNTTDSTVSSVTSATVTFEKYGSPVWVLTSVTFNATACKVESTSAQVFNLTAVTGDISLGSEVKTVVGTASLTTGKTGIYEVKSPGIIVTAS